MSNKQIVIFGDTMFSFELMRIIQMEGGNPIAFTLDSNYLKSPKFCDLPVYPFETLEQCVDIERVEILLSIGYNKMNKHRESKYQECKSRGFKIHTFVSKHALVYADSIGEGSIIMPGAYIGPFSNVGLCNVVRSRSVLSYHEKVGNFNWIADGCTYGGDVVQGNNCFIGLGTTVRNGISIADNTFVGAHSYLHHNTSYDSVYYGNPTVKQEMTSFEIISKV